MLFTQLEFPIFFVLVLIAVWLVRWWARRSASKQLATDNARGALTNGRVASHAILLAASYYFYAYWDYRFCGLLMLSTVVDFLVAHHLQRTEQVSKRRGLLLVSLAVNLGMLGFFKYCDFFIESARPILKSIGLSGDTLDIILPVGISFYTFQTLSYTIDVYRRVIKPVDSFLDFALYVAFFPQLVAGPIVRARELLPQFRDLPEWSQRRFYGGFALMLRGAVKKVLLADRLGEAVDVVFEAPELYSGVTVWIAVLAYAGQIYYDFCGYSDMAIGAAKMLGYRFPINFRHPYLATSMAEFWHRWHITLSRWLRDYLYISIGGNRISAASTYRNLLITMTLGGLWHGAAWTFVLWGVWHGVALSVERFMRARTSFRIPRSMAWLATLGVVLVGWVLFRSRDLDSAITVLHRMTSFSSGIVWLPPLALAALGCLVAEHIAWRTRLRRAMRLPVFAWYSPIAVTIMLWALLLYAPRGFRPFVYFQF